LVASMDTDKLSYLGVFALFEEVPEPRVERTRIHPLQNILIIALLAMICVGEGWEDMEEFGEAKEEWLGTFLDLRRGIPSADTFRRVLSAVDPKAFNACFIAWAHALSAGTAGKLIAIDGKSIRHSFDRATGRKALHVVSAWIASNRLTLGQVAIGEKSNEITAIPQLIEMLDIRGATITVDAMGCQRVIAEKVIEQGGDYVMGLKGNQGTAHKEVAAFFAEARASDFRNSDFTFHETVDGSEHGRLEVRRAWASQDLDWFVDLPKWKCLRSIVLIESERTVGTETSIERRYYWSSHRVDAETFSAMIRGHWGIENQLHWCLDVAFREDESRVRTDHGPENLALLRKVAMNLAKSERTHKRGIQAKRKLACWNDAYLLKLLQAGLPELPKLPGN
jgi:predicted transposase YbfD/YdcC